MPHDAGATYFKQATSSCSPNHRYSPMTQRVTTFNSTQLTSNSSEYHLICIESLLFFWPICSFNCFDIIPASLSLQFGFTASSNEYKPGVNLGSKYVFYSIYAKCSLRMKLVDNTTKRKTTL